MAKLFKWIETWLNKRMAKKISALPSATIPLVGGERFALVQAGTTVQVAVSSLSGGGGGANQAYTNVNNNFTVGQTINGALTARRASLSAIQLNNVWEVTSKNDNLFVGTLSEPAGNQSTVGITNIFIGPSAGRAVTSGSYNISIGDWAGKDIQTNSNSINIGRLAGQNAELGSRSVNIGYLAGQWQRSSFNAVSIGTRAGGDNIGSNCSVHIGAYAGEYDHQGDFNIFLGLRAGGQVFGNVDDVNLNTAIGRYAGRYMSGNAAFNVILGDNAGRTLGDADNNILVGKSAGSFAATPNNVIAIGYDAFRDGAASTSEAIFIGQKAGLTSAPDTGSVVIGAHASKFAQKGTVAVGYRAGLSAMCFYSTFLGFKAGENATTSSYSVAVGSYAGRRMSGQSNTFVGYNAGREITTGSGNTFLGKSSGETGISTGSSNTFVGHYTGVNSPALSTITGAIVLGARAKALSSNELVLGSTAVPLLTNVAAVTPASPFTFLQVRVNGQQFKLPLYT